MLPATRGSRLIAFGGIGLLLAGLVGLGVALAGQGLSRADSWSSVISGFVGLVGLAVTLVGRRRPVRREAGVLRRTGWGRQRLPADVHRLLEAQARAAESLPYQVLGVGSSRSTIYVRQQVESAAGPDDQRAVPVRGERDEERRRQRRARIRPAAQPIERVLGRHRHLVVEGGAGLGKSTLAREVTARLARAWLEGGAIPTPEPVVPVLVTAQALSHHRDRPWAEALTAAAAELGQHADSASVVDLARTDLGGASWLIIVDGLDEVPEPQRHELVEVLAARMAQSDSRARLMILTRPLPGGSLQRLQVAGGGTYTILPFTRVALREFVGKVIAARGDIGPDDRAARFLSELRRVELDEVATSPLLATIALAVFLDDPQRRLPRSRRELYDKFLEHLNDSSVARRPRLREQLRRRLGGVPGGAAAAAALYDRRRDLVEHLAVRRVASDESLASAALEWCRAAGIGPAEPVASWAEAVRDALAATGLMVVRDGSGLRFLHHSFAEHIAASHDARALPDTFDAGRDVWSGLVRQAVGDEGIATAVLVHWAGTRPAGALLTWLQCGSGSFQALALTLMGEGATAGPEHVRAGLRYVESEAWRSPGGHDALVRLLRGLPRDAETRGWALATVRDARGYPALQAAAALLLVDGPGAERDAAVTILRGRLGDNLPSGAHLAVARALVTLAPEHTVEAAGALRDALCRPDTQLGATARALADLGPEHLAAAVAELTALLRGAELTAGDRIEAAEMLAELDEQGWAESIAALRTVLGDNGAATGDRLNAAQAILEIGRDEPGDVVGWLRDLLAARGDDIWWAADAARVLVECGPADRQFAAAALHEIADSPHRQPWHRLRAASALVELGADDNGAGARVLLGVLADPVADAWDCREAATELSKLGGEHQAAAIAQVRAALADPDMHGSRIAVALARLCPEEVGEVTAALRRAAADPTISGWDLSEVARALAGLGPDHRWEACAALLEAARVRLDGDDAVNAVLSLTELYPESIEEAAAVCRTIAADPAREAHARAHAISVLAGMGPAHRRRAGELFATLLAETDADPLAAGRVIQMMNESLAEHRAAAVAHLAGLLGTDGLDTGEQVKLSIQLARLSPERRTEVATTLAGVATDPYIDSDSRLEAAEWLIRSADHRAEAVFGLRAVLRDPSATRWDLRGAATALSGLGDPHRTEAATVIADQLAQPGGDEERRAGLAIALSALPGHRPRAADVLRRLVADPGANPIWRVEAAEWLIETGIDRDVAMAGLTDVINDPSAAAWQVESAVNALTAAGAPARATARRALEARLANGSIDGWLALGPVLATLSSAGRATVTTMFGTLLDDPCAAVDEWLKAARWLAKASAHRPMVIARLRDLITDASLRSADRIAVADCLAEVSPPDHPVAVAAMRTLLADPWIPVSDRIDAADWLSRLPAHREGATTVLHDVLTDPATTPNDAINAGKLLCKRNRRHRDTVLAELQARTDNPHTDGRDRCNLAIALAEVSIGHRHTAADVLLALLSDPATEPSELIRIAQWLARLPAHRAAASATLDRLLSDPDLALDTRISAALAYAELCRPPQAELERGASRTATPGDRLVAAQAIAADPARGQDAAAVLDTVAADPAATVDERWHAATLLSVLPSGAARGADMLRELLAADGLSVNDRCLVARRLATLGGEHRQAAAGALRARLAADGPPTETIALAAALGEVSRGDRDWAVDRLLPVVTAERVPGHRRRWAADVLVGLARLDGRRLAARELLALLATNKLAVGVALVLAGLSPEDGAAALTRVLDDLGAPPGLRCEAAAALADVRSARRDGALSVLRRLCTDPTMPAYVRVEAGKALGSAGGDDARTGADALTVVCADARSDPADRLAAATTLTMLPTATADALAVITELATDAGNRPAVRRLAATVLAEVSPAQLATAANTLRELHHDAGVALAIRLMAAADLGRLGPTHRREGAELLRAAADAGEPGARLLAGTLLAAFPSAERQSGLDAIDRLASTTDLAPRVAAAARRARRRLDRLTA
jgi:hypothetical protein